MKLGSPDMRSESAAGPVPTSKMVGLLTGILIAGGGTVAVVALGSYFQTLPVRSLALAGAWVAGLTGGYGARASARFESSEPWLRLAAGIGTGLAIAVAVSMALYGIASVIGLFVFESSGFNSY
jgi:hypothetical protein